MTKLKHLILYEAFAAADDAAAEDTADDVATDDEEIVDDEVVEEEPLEPDVSGLGSKSGYEFENSDQIYLYLRNLKHDIEKGVSKDYKLVNSDIWDFSHSDFYLMLEFESVEWDSMWQVVIKISWNEEEDFPEESEIVFKEYLGDGLEFNIYDNKLHKVSEIDVDYIIGEIESLIDQSA